MSGGLLFVNEKAPDGCSQHTYHALLRRTLNEVLRVFLLEYVREGGVLAVTVQHDDSVICTAQLSQGQTTCFPSSYLEVKQQSFLEWV